MKTLSVKQPFAYLLCAGIKDIENRSWRLPEKHRNEWVLVHASKKPNADYSLSSMLSREQYKDAENRMMGLKALFATFDNSAIIGAVKYSDCVINHPSIWAEKTEGVMVGHTFVYKEGKKPIYNWVVSEAILFDKPILNVKGKLSFWDFDLPEEYVKLLK
mgnify:CR=1 FL=1